MPEIHFTSVECMSSKGWTKFGLSVQTVFTQLTFFRTKGKSNGGQAKVWPNSNLIWLPFNISFQLFSVLLTKLQSCSKGTQHLFDKFVEINVEQKLKHEHDFWRSNVHLGGTDFIWYTVVCLPLLVVGIFSLSILCNGFILLRNSKVQSTWWKSVSFPSATFYDKQINHNINTAN